MECQSALIRIDKIWLSLYLLLDCQHIYPDEQTR